MLIRLFICRSVDQFHDGLNGIHLMAFAHGVYIILAVKVQFMYFIYQKIRRNIILIQDNGISLGFEGSSVQQLVSAAAGSRQGDQDVSGISLLLNMDTMETASAVVEHSQRV